MAKATTTIRQMLNYRPDVQAYFAANQSLFNRVAAFYFDVIQAHSKVLGSLKQRSTHELWKSSLTPPRCNPHPVMPLSEIGEDIPAMFRRAAINAALGSARSFFWQSCTMAQAQRESRGKRQEVP